MSETLTVKVVCHRYRRLRPGSALGVVLADIINPLPDNKIWTLEDQERTDRAGRPQFYRTRSGLLPGTLAGCDEGEVVTIRATVQRWGNGLGGWVSRVVMCPPERWAAR